MMEVNSGGFISGRRVDFVNHVSGAELGYETPRRDTFAIVHPKSGAGVHPLYVVLHSAGHDVYSAVACTRYVGNHDIYHAPDEAYGLYLDCREHEDTDWWWGGADTFGNGEPSRRTTKQQPVERRVIATIMWMFEHYPIDRTRVYGVGNSMGGSGMLGLALGRGDIFAAIKLNVPAGVHHAYDRWLLDSPEKKMPIPDPPIIIDYSAQDDINSHGHELLYDAAVRRRYALIGYFGCFGHENNHAEIEKVNDLVNSFPFMSVRLNEAYPAFTNASTDDEIPWGSDREIKESGQVNAFFRYRTVSDSEDRFEMALRLMTQADHPTWVVLPDESTADVTLRRLQNFRVQPHETVAYTFGNSSGTVCADETGHVTIPKLCVRADETLLTLERAPQPKPKKKTRKK